MYRAPPPDNECAVLRSNHHLEARRTPSPDRAGAPRAHEQCLYPRRERRSRSDSDATRRICRRSGSDQPFRCKTAAACGGVAAQRPPADRARAWRLRPSRCEAASFVKLVERAAARRRLPPIARLQQASPAAAFGTEPIPPSGLPANANQKILRRTYDSTVKRIDMSSIETIGTYTLTLSRSTRTSPGKWPNQASHPRIVTKPTTIRIRPSRTINWPSGLLPTTKYLLSVPGGRYHSSR